MAIVKYQIFAHPGRVLENVHVSARLLHTDFKQAILRQLMSNVWDRKPDSHEGRGFQSHIPLQSTNYCLPCLSQHDFQKEI